MVLSLLVQLPTIQLLSIRVYIRVFVCVLEIVRGSITGYVMGIPKVLLEHCLCLLNYVLKNPCVNTDNDLPVAEWLCLLIFV